MVGMGTATSLPLMVRFAFGSGLVMPLAAVSLRARLGTFPIAEPLRLIAVDQTVIRTAGTVGMLILPFLVDASPAGAFTTAGLTLAATAALAGVAGTRLQPDAAPVAGTAEPVLAPR